MQDFLAKLDPRRARRVLRTLQDYVPFSGPEQWARSEFSKRLVGSDGIFEFRWPTRGGGTPRVLWFYDEGKVIVCTHGLDKKGPMPRTEVVSAEQARRAHMAAKAVGRIEVLEAGLRWPP